MKLRRRRRFGKQEQLRSLLECARHEAVDGTQTRETHSGRGRHAASILSCYNRYDGEARISSGDDAAPR